MGVRSKDFIVFSATAIIRRSSHSVTAPTHFSRLAKHLEAVQTRPHPAPHQPQLHAQEPVADPFPDPLASAFAQAVFGAVIASLLDLETFPGALGHHQ